jgi:hypothetical protein
MVKKANLRGESILFILRFTLLPLRNHYFIALPTSNRNSRLIGVIPSYYGPLHLNPNRDDATTSFFVMILVALF